MVLLSWEQRLPVSTVVWIYGTLHDPRPVNSLTFGKVRDRLNISSSYQ